MKRTRLLALLVLVTLATPALSFAGDFWENLIVGVLQGLVNASVNTRVRSDLGAVDAHLGHNDTWRAQTQLVETRRFLMGLNDYSYRRLSEELAVIESDIRSGRIDFARRRISHILRNLPVIAQPTPGPGHNPGHNPGYNPGHNPGYNPGHNPGYNPGYNNGADQALYRTSLQRLQNAQYNLRNRDYRRAVAECRAVESDFAWRTSPLDRQILAGVQRVIQGITGGNYPGAMAQLNGLTRTVQDAANGQSWGNGGNGNSYVQDPYELNRRRWAQDLRAIIVDVRDGRFDYARRGLDRLIADVTRASQGSGNGNGNAWGHNQGHGNPHGSRTSPQLRELGRRLRFVAQGLQGWNPDRRETIQQLRQIRRELDSSSVDNW